MLLAYTILKGKYKFAIEPLIFQVGLQLSIVFVPGESLILPGAVSKIHPRLICDFHIFQTLERWVNCSQNNVPPEVRSIVKAAIMEFVHANNG